MSTPQRDLVLGNRILAHHAILDAYGHCSIRDPERPDRVIIARARAPELVTEDDLQTFDLLGTLVGADSRPSYIERFIHSATTRRPRTCTRSATATRPQSFRSA